MAAAAAEAAAAVNALSSDVEEARRDRSCDGCRDAMPGGGHAICGKRTFQLIQRILCLEAS